MRIKHLPKLAIIAIAIGMLAVLTGTTYAVVKTVEQFNNVHVEQSGTNEFGREQLSVTFDNCESVGGSDSLYELKKGSGLSVDEGSRVLQAKCEMDEIASWLKDNLAEKYLLPPELLGTVYTIKSVGETELTLEGDGVEKFPASAKVLLNNKEVGRDTLNTGDSILYYPGAYVKKQAPESDDVIVFKLSQPERFYDDEMQSYVNARGACRGNPDRMCLQSNGRNQVSLIIANGAGTHTIDEPELTKEAQGKIVSYTDSAIKIDVGKGVIYTIDTPYNVVEYYNTTTVPLLPSMQTYAKTDPTALRTEIGDNLNINYLESEAASSHTIDWSTVFTIGLMVERIPKDIEVIQKY